MIRIEPQPEPNDFEILVRRPGRQFLRRIPNPKSREWRSHSYWRNVSGELRSAYNGICAYTCHWIPTDTGAGTVEHFKPKSKHPQDAYEWDNYRLVCSMLNGRKGNHEDVLDPFTIQDGWFVLDFPSLLVKPAPDLDDDLRAKVIATRKRLKLNDDESCVEARLQWVRDYCEGNISHDHLRKHAPFIARQIEQQGLIDALPEIMGFPS